MSSESPLASSVRQAFRQGESSFSRTYRGVAINPNDPNAYLQLTSVSPPLPEVGDTIDGTGYTVTGINIQPVGSRSDIADVVVTYSTQPNQGGIATVANQPGTEVSFEIYPESLDATVVGAKASPLVTETIELDEQGQPVGNPPNKIGTVYPTIETVERTFRLDRARVVYTVTGTAAALGLPTGFVMGTVPFALSQQRFLHVIGGVPLLFRLGSIRQVRRSQATPNSPSNPSQHTYAISYEWLYDAGLRWDSPPAEWVADPGLGPADDLVVVAGSRGVVNETGDFDILSGVFVPDIEAPADVAAILGNGARYILPPYCEVDLVLKVDHSFPYPSFVPRPLYQRADQAARDAWQSLPGV